MRCEKCGHLTLNRSQQANKYYWAVIVKTLSDKTGYTPEEIHELLKYKFLQRESLQIGEEKIEVSTTKKLSKQDHHDYCRRIELWMNQTLGLYLPAEESLIEADRRFCESERHAEARNSDAERAAAYRSEYD